MSDGSNSVSISRLSASALAMTVSASRGLLLEALVHLLGHVLEGDVRHGVGSVAE
jgi:hypothetical protein